MRTTDMSPPAVRIRNWNVRHSLQHVPHQTVERDRAAHLGALGAICPGDILFVGGRGRVLETGNAGGLFGHVMVVVKRPMSVRWGSYDAEHLRDAWPEDAAELWRVSTMESTRREQGLYQSDALLMVEPRTNALILVGELNRRGEVSDCDHEPVEVWQSPKALRTALRLDIIESVLADMEAAMSSSNWSMTTAARAAFLSAKVTRLSDSASTLKEIQACWNEDPICTSVAIIFWQRYLCKLVENSEGRAVDLILRWMPLKADRGLPGELTSILDSAGWTHTQRAVGVAVPQVSVVADGLSVKQAAQRIEQRLASRGRVR